MIMTINEQIKEILEIHRKSVDWKKEAPTFNDYRADKIMALIQPKTTSTDIEEVTGKFITMTSDYYASHPKETWVMDYTTKVIDFFLPHLSNKSELKKEAVMGFVGFLSKQLLAVGGTWQELELKQKTLDKINRSAQTYLSSNEKEVSQLNKEGE